MDYYRHLDPREKEIYEGYAARLNNSSSKDFLSPLASSRSNLTQRLPSVNSFSSILSKPKDHELIPRPETERAQLKTSRVPSPKRKRSSKPRMNGKFYSENGLNLKHPDLKNQIRKIFNLIEGHQYMCHQDLQMVEFSDIKKHFL
jgi:hypothetical protein